MQRGWLSCQRTFSSLAASVGRRGRNELGWCGGGLEGEREVGGERHWDGFLNWGVGGGRFEGGDEMMLSFFATVGNNIYKWAIILLGGFWIVFDHYFILIQCNSTINLCIHRFYIKPPRPPVTLLMLPTFTSPATVREFSFPLTTQVWCTFWIGWLLLFGRSSISIPDVLPSVNAGMM